MRRNAVLYVVLGLIFISFGLLSVMMAILTLLEPYRCGDAPCDFYETWRSSRDPAYGFGGAVLFFAVGGGLIWNVWRGQG
jgi:hypothetical protein